MAWHRVESVASHLVSEFLWKMISPLKRSVSLHNEAKFTVWKIGFSLLGPSCPQARVDAQTLAQHHIHSRTANKKIKSSNVDRLQYDSNQSAKKEWGMGRGRGILTWVIFV